MRTLPVGALFNVACRKLPCASTGVDCNVVGIEMCADAKHVHVIEFVAMFFASLIKPLSLKNEKVLKSLGRYRPAWVCMSSKVGMMGLL